MLDKINLFLFRLKTRVIPLFTRLLANQPNGNTISLCHRHDHECSIEKILISYFIKECLHLFKIKLN